MIKEKNSNELLEDIISEEMTLVDVYATWCGPCKMIVPNIEEVSKKLGIEVIKVDIDENIDVARTYNIDSIPTLLLFKNKKLIDMSVGYRETSYLENWILKNK